MRYLAALAVFVASCGQPAYAQQFQRCYPDRDSAIAAYAEHFGEAPFVRGIVLASLLPNPMNAALAPGETLTIEPGTAVLELFVNQETGSWTTVIHYAQPGFGSCMFSSGMAMEPSFSAEMPLQGDPS